MAAIITSAHISNNSYIITIQVARNFNFFDSMRVIKSKRVITAEKKGRVWKVYVKNPNKTQSAVCHTKEPLKALRYAFMLKAKFGLNIGANFVDRLMHEHNTLKNVAV